MDGNGKGKNEQAGPIIPGRLRPGFQPLYSDIRLYAPLIGSDALALYCILLTFRHGGGIEQTTVNYAWPGTRELCRLLQWGSGRHGDKKSKLDRCLDILEAAGLIERTTIGNLIDRKAITKERAREMLPRTSDEFRRRKRVILVNDPLENEDFQKHRGEIEAALARLRRQEAVQDEEADLPPHGETSRLQDEEMGLVSACGDKTCLRMGRQDLSPHAETDSDRVTRSRDLKITTGPPVIIVAPTPTTVTPKETAGTILGTERGPTPTNDVVSVVGPSGNDGAGHLPERELVRYWLQEYGVVGPLLEDLSGQVSLVQVRAWMLYLEHQKRLDDEARRGILINRLRAKDEPPRRYRSWARLLPPVDPVEEFMLEQNYQAYCWTGKWSEDVLDVVGEERAGLWAEARKRRPEA